MARDLDVQLLEAVAVRRSRLRESLLWGRNRRRLAVGNTVRLFVIGLVIAAVCCAGCVGWSLLQQVLASRPGVSTGAPAR